MTRIAGRICACWALVCQAVYEDNNRLQIKLGDSEAAALAHETRSVALNLHVFSSFVDSVSRGVTDASKGGL